MKRGILIAGLIATLIVVAGALFLNMQADGRPLAVGQKAPDFTLESAIGGQGSLSDLRGRVVLLNFWATWCAPCIQEMPSLQKLYRRFEGDDFEVVAVSLDKEGAGVVKDFMEQKHLTFSIPVDPQGLTESSYRLMGVPETYILDKEGVIRHRILGPKDWTDEANLALVSEVLGRPPKSASASGATGPTMQLSPEMIAELTKSLGFGTPK